MCDLTGKFTGETEVSAGHLDPTPNTVFRRNSMKSRIHFNCPATPMHFASRLLLVLGVAAFLFPESGKASVVFKPGKKPEYVGPDGVEEELSGDAVDLFQIGQAAEKEGNTKRAIRAYKSLVKRHPKDKVAPNALYRAAQLQEQAHLFFAAADSFSQLVEKYPGSPHFDEAIEAQFRIGEIYLNGKKLRFLGIPVASALDRAVTVCAIVVGS